MIEWKRYDHSKPPETDKCYLVSDGREVDVADYHNYLDEPKWYLPDRSQIDEPRITHYANINLPAGEDGDK